MSFTSGCTATKRRPDLFLEFCLAWIAHSVDAGPGAVVVWDSGQFHHAGGRARLS